MPKLCPAMPQQLASDDQQLTSLLHELALPGHQRQ
jgi:hypothetical protein